MKEQHKSTEKETLSHHERKYPKLHSLSSSNNPKKKLFRHNQMVKKSSMLKVHKPILVLTKPNVLTLT